MNQDIRPGYYRFCGLDGEMLLILVLKSASGEFYWCYHGHKELSSFSPSFFVTESWERLEISDNAQGIS